MFVLILMLTSGCNQKSIDYQGVTMDALMNKNVNKCNNLNSSDYVLTCYVAYAKYHNDSDVCQKIPTEKDKSTCINRYNMN